MAWRYCCIVRSDFKKRFTIFKSCLHGFPKYYVYITLANPKPLFFLRSFPEYCSKFWNFLVDLGGPKAISFLFFQIRLIVCSGSLDSSPLIIVLSNRYLDHPVATGRFSVKKSELCCWIEKHSSSSWRDKLALNFLTGN